MLMRLFPVVVLSAALFCAGMAEAAKFKPIIPEQTEAAGGHRSLPQRGDRAKDQDDARALISAPEKSRVPGTAGGGSHTDREA